MKFTLFKSTTILKMLSMKKQFLLFVLILCLSFSVKSQNFKFGIKGGVNLNSIGELYHWGNTTGGTTNVRPDEDTYYTANKDMGLQFGAFLMVEYEKFYLKPEINYVTYKNNYALDLNTANWESTEFNIPILFGYRILNSVSVFGGPSFSFISDQTFETLDDALPYTYKDSSMNGQVGVMVGLGPVDIDVRYQYGFSKVETQQIDMNRSHYGTNRGQLLEYNPSQIFVNLSINLLDLSKLKGRNKVNKGWRHSKNLCGSL